MLLRSARDNQALFANEGSRRCGVLGCQGQTKCEVKPWPQWPLPRFSYQHSLTLNQKRGGGGGANDDEQQQQQQQQQQ